MQILKTGSTGAEVALLQLSLRRAQYGGPAPDGVFGGATKSALQTFQRSHGLTPDGIFGAETERVLAPWLRGYAVHTVRPGDTLFSLAERYDASLAAIETANPSLDPFALRPGQRITVPLPFSVVPTDIPWCSALMDYAVDGLTHRYPQLRAESIGRSALSRPIWALTAGDGLRRVLYSAAHHANQLRLRILLLEVQPTKHAFHTHRLIILNKVNVNARFLHIFFVVSFHEIATGIAMNRRLDHTKSFDAAYIFLNFNLSHFFYLLLLLDFFQITAQCILPSRKRSKSCFHQLALI